MDSHFPSLPGVIIDSAFVWTLLSENYSSALEISRYYVIILGLQMEGLTTQGVRIAHQSSSWQEMPDTLPTSLFMCLLYYTVQRSKWKKETDLYDSLTRSLPDRDDNATSGNYLCYSWHFAGREIMCATWTRNQKATLGHFSHLTLSVGDLEVIYGVN